MKGDVINWVNFLMLVLLCRKVRGGEGIVNEVNDMYKGGLEWWGIRIVV